MKTIAVILAAVVVTLAEPPAPQSHYLGSNQYLPSSRQSSFTPPSTKYGTPSIEYGTPSTKYGTPDNEYGTPNTEYGTPSISSTYSAPSFNKIPSIQYESPRVNTQYGAPQTSYLPVSYRSHNDYEDDKSEPANYNFQYDVQDAEHGNDFGHTETRQDDNAQGKYTVLLPDGRKQTVEYTADENGFKPKITYEQTNNGYNYGRSNGYSNGGYNNGAYRNAGYSSEVYNSGDVQISSSKADDYNNHNSGYQY